jgi:SAM-dependent methyltransferase
MTIEDRPSGELDHELLLAEIYAEVVRRRASGELPADLERQLDQAFAEVAPPGAVGDARTVLIERVQRSSFIEPRVPLDDLRPPVSQVKRVLFKLMAWYVHFVTDQVSALGGAVAAALRGHEDRLVALEQGGTEVPAKLRSRLDRLPERPPHPDLLRLVTESLAGTQGRVVVGDFGDGSVLRALRAVGVDAYGTEPRPSRLPSALREGFEIRPTTVLEHLEVLGADRLAAVVLVGSPVERSVPLAQARLAEAAARVIRPGGSLLVLSTTPDAWLRGDLEPLADLAPGRPLRVATWAYLLTEAGLAGVATHHAPPNRPLPVVDPTAEDGAIVAELIERLTPLLAPPEAYLLIARRPT